MYLSYTLSLQSCCPLTYLALWGCHSVLSRHNNFECSWVILSLCTANLESWTESFTLFFKSLADLAFHQSWDVHPILPEFLCSVVNESLADYQCSLSSTLWHQPFFQSLSPFVHLHCYLPDSFNPGVWPIPCTVGDDWSSLFEHDVPSIPSADLAHLVPGAGHVWQNAVPFFVKCLQWESQVSSRVPFNFSVWVTLIVINSINSHFFRAENQ